MRKSEGDRSLANIVLAVGFVVLVGAGIWLANAMVTRRRLTNDLVGPAQLLSDRGPSAMIARRNVK